VGLLPVFQGVVPIHIRSKVLLTRLLTVYIVFCIVIFDTSFEPEILPLQWTEGGVPQWDCLGDDFFNGGIQLWMLLRVKVVDVAGYSNIS
jgi:hypothetical protein